MLTNIFHSVITYRPYFLLRKGLSLNAVTMATTTQTNPAAVPLIIQGTATEPVHQNQQPSSTNQTFPVRTLKVFGSVQIGLGILVGILSIIGVVFDAIAMHKYDLCGSYLYGGDEHWFCRGRGEHFHRQFAFDLSSLILSGWVCTFFKLYFDDI